MSAPTTLNPREWAIWLIRPYVERGDDLKWISDSWMGHYGTHTVGGRDVSVHINCTVNVHYAWHGPDDYREVKVGPGKIGGALGDEITGVYTLAELAREIKSGSSQPALFEVAS